MVALARLVELDSAPPARAGAVQDELRNNHALHRYLGAGKAHRRQRSNELIPVHSLILHPCDLLIVVCQVDSPHEGVPPRRQDARCRGPAAGPLGADPFPRR